MHKISRIQFRVLGVGAFGLFELHAAELKER